MIKGAIFDVFGTVVDWRRGVAEGLRPILAEAGVGHDPWAIADAWRAEYQPGMEAVRAGRRGYVRLEVLHRENLDRALEGLGLGAQIDMPTREAMNRVWERLPPWPDSPAGLAAIRERVPVATCSNGSIAMMVRIARHAGLVWDAILGAEIAQGYKPDPAVYLATAGALGLRPQEVVMVAAHNGDLAAAAALGFQTAFVARPTEHGPSQTTDLAPSGPWTVAASDMIELARRLAP